MKELDLHGIKHENVRQLLDSFIWMHMQNKTGTIKIITGNSSEMTNIVKTVVEEYGFSVVYKLGNSAEIIVDLI